MPFESVAFLPKQNFVAPVLFLLCSMLFCLHSRQMFGCQKVSRVKASEGVLLSEEKLVGPSSCIWEIEAPQGFRIELAVARFEIKTSCCRCVYDYVEFRDGLAYNSPRIGQRYCANNNPTKVYSSRNSLKVQYYSSKDLHLNHTTGNKFKAKFRRICGEFYQGVFWNIFYPRNVLPHTNPNSTTDILRIKPTYCLFTIVVPFGWVKVTFTNNSIPACNPCAVIGKDMGLIEFRNTTQGPEKLCGKLKSPYIFSKGREFSLFYPLVNKLNFTVKFEATSQSLAPCGGTLTDDTGYIYSYGYPRPSPKNTECIWKIEVPYGYVKLNFLKFDFVSPNEQSCTHGKLQIYDGWSDDSEKIKSTYCHGGKHAQSVKSRSNRLKIKASTTYWLGNWTFVLSYELDREALCSDSQFTCTNRKCVSHEAFCDGTVDCLDGSDELNCPKEKHGKGLYVLWALIVLFASILMVIWIWKTWRKAVHRTHHVQREQQRDEGNEYEAPSHSGAPPSYTEALNHPSTCLPSYEEALLCENTGEVILREDNTVQYLACSDSNCNGQLLPTSNAQRTIQYV